MGYIETMTTKAEKKLIKDNERRIERAFYKTCSGIQVGIFDLSKIMKRGHELLASGVDEEGLEAGIRAFVETIRKN
jgi:hypothetical protein